MTLQSTIARLAAVTEAHGASLLSKGDEPGACVMFAIQELADDLLRALSDEDAAAVVEELMSLDVRSFELLAALSQAVDGAPHARRLVEDAA